MNAEANVQNTIEPTQTNLPELAQEALVSLETADVKKNSSFGNGKKKLFACLFEAGLYVGAFLVALILYLTIKPLIDYQRKGIVAQSVTVCVIAAIIAVIAYMGITKRLTANRLVFLLLLIGLMLRIGYVLYSPAATRQHDVYSKNFDAHEAYAWTIFQTGKLPTTNAYQFYHPPLNAALQAFFMKFLSGFTDLLTKIFGGGTYFPDAFQYAKPSYIKDANRYFLYGGCQILSIVYSFITCVVTLKILKLFDLSDTIYVGAAAFVILFPRTIQFSGMLNNDPVSLMFGILALYYALKWWKGGKSLVYILLCAFSVGLGMSAKLSSATVCLPIAGIFICEFIRTLRKKEGSIKLSKMVIQYTLFLCVCAPIGLWFQVYAKIRFNQSFGYVFSNLNRKLYTGDKSLFERLIFAFDFSEYFGSIYCRPFEGNYNLFNYSIRSAIFGEFSYWQGEGFAVAALLLAYMAATLLFVALIFMAVRYLRERKTEDFPLRKKTIAFDDLLFLFLLMQSQAVSEMYFYVTMPYGCTMDFRYIMPIIPAIALTLGYTHKVLVTSKGKVALAIDRLLMITTAGFLVCSSLFYCVCI